MINNGFMITMTHLIIIWSRVYPKSLAYLVDELTITKFCNGHYVISLCKKKC